MLTFLLLLSVIFLTIIGYLLYKIQTDRLRFKGKIRVLEDFIVQVSREQTAQNNQLLLSEELKQKLKIINATLNKDIFDLNYQLFEELQSRK
ncbi:hypothetical protein [Flavobacterium sp. XGLA_31]|uniref:hypothetical protein n=1 Tax=Flavobacterium sp. XGLA_31 TaxID=3447666 RepID=UPI003F402DE8